MTQLPRPQKMWKPAASIRIISNEIENGVHFCLLPPLYKIICTQNVLVSEVSEKYKTSVDLDNKCKIAVLFDSIDLFIYRKAAALVWE